MALLASDFSSKSYPFGSEQTLPFSAFLTLWPSMILAVGLGFRSSCSRQLLVATATNPEIRYCNMNAGEPGYLRCVMLVGLFKLKFHGQPLIGPTWRGGAQSGLQVARYVDA